MIKLWEKHIPVRYKMHGKWNSYIFYKIGSFPQSYERQIILQDRSLLWFMYHANSFINSWLTRNIQFICSTLEYCTLNYMGNLSPRLQRLANKDILTKHSSDKRNPYHHRDDSSGHMMTSSNGNIFRVTGHLCGEFTGPRWIPRTKASDAEFWCFLWSASE